MPLLTPPARQVLTTLTTSPLLLFLHLACTLRGVILTPLPTSLRALLVALVVVVVVEECPEHLTATEIFFNPPKELTVAKAGKNKLSWITIRKRNEHACTEDTSLSLCPKCHYVSNVNFKCT